MRKTPFLAAVALAGSILFDTERTIARFKDLSRDAAARGAKLIVFPEAFIGGYPKGSHFGAPVGPRSAEGRDLFRRYHESASDVPGPEVEAFARFWRPSRPDAAVIAPAASPEIIPSRSKERTTNFSTSMRRAFWSSILPKEQDKKGEAPVESPARLV